MAGIIQSNSVHIPQITLRRIRTQCHLFQSSGGLVTKALQSAVEGIKSQQLTLEHVCHVFPIRLVKLAELAVASLGDEPRSAAQGPSRMLALVIE